MKKEKNNDPEAYYNAFHPEKKQKSNRLSASFITGAIALAFLIIGYQFAIFIHKAAVISIASRDATPDTVYVLLQPDISPGSTSSRPTPPSSGYTNKTISPTNNTNSLIENTIDPTDNTIYPTNNTNSLTDNTIAQTNKTISPTGKDNKISLTKGTKVISKTTAKGKYHDLVKAVQDQYAPRPVEEFRFNPNTATVEDFRRLGFSEKQAQSIDNYRQKGGRFNRKTDFAKSFVVSEATYARLEPYIDIPKLNINKADSAAFDALPGIGPHFAAEMVRYRGKLGGYSSTQQLVEIWNFGEDRLESLKDLIFVDKVDVKPFRLWSLPADSLKLHPHIYNYKIANAIVLFRAHTPRDQWTIPALEAAGILPHDKATLLQRCLIATPHDSSTSPAGSHESSSEGSHERSREGSHERSRESSRESSRPLADKNGSC